MDDEFEFGVPPELSEWIESLRLNPPVYYILRDYKLVSVSMMEWARWFEDPSQRIIDSTYLDNIHISTVFLGIDHNFGFDDLVNHRPILFESMVFGGKLDQFQWRYSTLGDAKQGHYELVEAVRNNREPKMTWGQEGFWNNFRDMFE